LKLPTETFLTMRPQLKCIVIALLALNSCSTPAETIRAPWPEKITNLDNELTVEHSVDTVFATINTKDPEKRGKYQLQFTTSIASLKGTVRIEEFGGYLLKDNEWSLASIYNRPFNNEEFAKWYRCENGTLNEGETYSDKDNWLGKTNKLTNDTIVSLWYYIGTNEKGKKVVGAKEIIGVLREK
jgi:hypothetical protein